jgi:hypothetical protein
MPGPSYHAIFEDILGSSESSSLGRTPVVSANGGEVYSTPCGSSLSVLRGSGVDTDLETVNAMGLPADHTESSLACIWPRSEVRD